MGEIAAASKSSKMRWTSQEDRLLVQSVETNGTTDWSIVARTLPNRNGKQCRERWINQLNPGLKLEVWTPEEDKALIALTRVHGHQWALIAQSLDGRSVTSTRNRFTCLMRHLARQRKRSPPPRMDPGFPPFPVHTALPSQGMTSQPRTDLGPPKVKLPPISEIFLGANAGFIPQLWS
jgi:hypothetical protein